MLYVVIALRGRVSYLKLALLTSLTNSESSGFLMYVIFFLHDICLIPQKSVILFPRVFCCSVLSILLRLCSVIPASSCLASIFLLIFAWDAVYAVLCFLDLVFVWSIKQFLSDIFRMHGTSVVFCLILPEDFVYTFCRVCNAY